MTRQGHGAVEGARNAPRAISLVGLGVLLLVYVWGAWDLRHYVNDDAYVTFRYSRFLAEGHGPYYNIGEHVEGYTNFLLMMILAGAIALGGPACAPSAAKVIGVGCGALTLAAVFCLPRWICRTEKTRPWGPWTAGLLAAGLLAVSPSFVLNSVNGLETTLFGLALASGLLLNAMSEKKGGWRGSGLAFAAACLTRPEGIVLFFASVLPRLSAQGKDSHRRRRFILPDVAIVALALAGHLLLRYVMYDGHWLPNTYHAKSGGFWKVDAWSYVWSGLGPPLGGAVGLSAAVMGYLLMENRSWRIAPVASVALAGAALPFVTGADWMPGWRMTAPYLPVWATLVGIGWHALVCRAMPRRPGLALGVLALLVPALWARQDPIRTELSYVIRMRAQGYKHGHEAMAQWLKQETKPGDTIALMDIGIVGFRCIEQRILDITGLTDRTIARSPGGFLRKEYDADYVLEQRPACIVLVLTPGGDLGALPEGISLRAWTPMEERIWKHPEFQMLYRDPKGGAPEGDQELAKLAEALGARRVFRHRHPDVNYYLAVFCLREEEDPG